MLKRFIPKCRNCIHLVEKTQFCNRYNVPAVEARLDYKLCNVKAVGIQTAIDGHEALKNEYENKSKLYGYKSICYFALSFTNFYFFCYSIPELTSIIFATLSGGFIVFGHYHIEKMNYHKKTFLTNNTKTILETKHK